MALPEKVGVTYEMSVEGRPSGDCECFCFDVAEKEYLRICGQEDYDREIKERIQDKAPNRPWRIYPNDLFGSGENYIKVKMTIEVMKEL